MKIQLLSAASAVALISTPSLAQDAATDQAEQAAMPVATPVQAAEAPLQVARLVEETGPALPANTELTLRTNQEITTKGKKWSEGDTFDLSVVHNVMLGDYVVIPAGSRGVGRITWLTSKGAFGKSGKMDIELEYVEVSGRRIPVNGTYRQEGEGNTVATVGGVILAGVFAGFITGKSGRIPQGRELTAYTEDEIRLALPKQPPAIIAPSQADSTEPKQPVRPPNVIKVGN